MAEEAHPDHIPMLVEFHRSTARGDNGYLKGKSSVLVFDRHANLKYNMETVIYGVAGISLIQWGRTKKRIADYIRTRVREDVIRIG